MFNKHEVLSRFRVWCQLKFIPSFLDLLFPMQCIHCKSPLPESLKLFCANCLSELVISQPSERCRTCYSYKGDEACQGCMKTSSPFYKTYGVFELSPAIQTLAQKLSHSSGAFLANSAAGLLVMNLNPSPIREFDLIVPSFDAASLRLSKAFGHLLGIPVAEVFQKKGIIEPKTAIKQSRSELILEKRVLLVSTGQNSFAQYREEGLLLADAFPRSIQKLFLFRSYR